jgi:4'-phosphopantetheinyl transferase EntD
VIEELLPDTVVVVETRGDRDEPLLRGEESALAGVKDPRRRREYVTTRACARAALERLEVEPVPILSGRHGEPLWPEGVTGSLTHCPGYRAAAVARTSDITSIGIDAEADGEDRLLFSARESVYKATGAEENEIEIGDGTFTAPGQELQGRWLIRDGLVLTATWRAASLRRAS